jgi:hypothetical protein
LGGLGDTGQSGPKKPIKVAPKVTGRVSFFKAFLSTVAEKYTLEKEVFFRSLARVPFFRFLSLLGGFGGTLWRGFCTNIDCSLENATSQKAWFYVGISTVLTVAAGPGSIKGEKNRHAEAMPVLGSRKNSSANYF